MKRKQVISFGLSLLGIALLIAGYILGAYEYRQITLLTGVVAAKHHFPAHKDSVVEPIGQTSVVVPVDVSDQYQLVLGGVSVAGKKQQQVIYVSAEQFNQISIGDHYTFSPRNGHWDISPAEGGR